MENRFGHHILNRAPLVEVVDGEEVPFDPGRGLGGALAPPDDSDCADVVIYSPVSEYIVPVAQHYWGYDTEQGFAMKTRSFVGSTDPLEARAVIQSVAAANEAYMDACEPDCPREYALRPILQIVGDTMGRMDGDLMRFTYMDDCVSVAVSCAGL